MIIFFLSQVSTSQVSTSARPRLMPPPSTRPSFPGVVVNPPGHEINIPGIVVDPPFLQVILTIQVLMVFYSLFSVYFPFPFQVSTSQVSTSARPRLEIPPSSRPQLSSFPEIVVGSPDRVVPHHGVPPSLQVIRLSICFNYSACFFFLVIFKLMDFMLILFSLLCRFLLLLGPAL